MSKLKEIIFSLNVGLLSIFSCSATAPPIADGGITRSVSSDSLAALAAPLKDGREISISRSGGISTCSSLPGGLISLDIFEHTEAARIPLDNESSPLLFTKGRHRLSLQTREEIRERIEYASNSSSAEEEPRGRRRKRRSHSVGLTEIEVGRGAGLVLSNAHNFHKIPAAAKIILSIDGGGTRGIIPLFYIMELERRLGVERLEVDMIAGTSVGALVGAAVALNKEKELYEGFHSFAEQAFAQAKSGRSAGGFFRPRYKNSGRRGAIESFVGDMNASQLGIELVVPYYCYNLHEPRTYSSSSSDDFKLLDLLMMTSAAPTYFNPHECKSLDGQEVSGGDGGLFANHPGEAAYHIARQKYPDSKIVMISLGTGRINQCVDSDYYYNRGLLFWAKEISDLAISLNTADRCAGLSFIASEVDRNFEYIRIQPDLRREMFKMDDVSRSQMRMRIDSARRGIIGSGVLRRSFERALEVLRERGNA
ncbi:MAG: patatin-like phospholipase family protein [Holosporaceae bacterium]|jgi:predicted acylesterase/phospholipase RssA|nr:patatin-like phospholipase family protein [Holosporaceae bacterium]